MAGLGWPGSLKSLWSRQREFPLGYSASLDGARGVMTLGVLAAHLHYHWYPGAIIFMDTFFLMSSYLITSLLIKDQDSAGRVNFRRFYERRVRRLFPALLAMLLVYTVAILWLGRPRELEFRAIGATLFYFMNWARAFEWPMSPYLGHAWSLSIEEQFYALWPLAFALLMRRPGRLRQLAWGLALLAVASAAWRWWLATQGAGLARLYNGTDVRLDGLCLGAALAFFRRAQVRAGQPLLAPAVQSALAAATPVVALVLFVWGFSASYYDRSWYLWQSQLCMALSLVLVAGLVLCDRTLLHPLLEAAPAVFLGRICYGLYIWHHPIFLIMEDHLKLDLSTRVWVGLPLTFAVATISYHLIELPFMTRKPRPQPATAHVH